MISNKDGALLSEFANSNENDISVLDRLADLLTQIRSTPHQKKIKTTTLMRIEVK